MGGGGSKYYSNIMTRGSIYYGGQNIISHWSHTFMEISHEIVSTVVLLPSAETFKKSCCQLQAKVCAPSTGQPLVQACPGKGVVR